MDRWHYLGLWKRVCAAWAPGNGPWIVDARVKDPMLRNGMFFLRVRFHNLMQKAALRR